MLKSQQRSSTPHQSFILTHVLHQLRVIAKVCRFAKVRNKRLFDLRTSENGLLFVAETGDRAEVIEYDVGIGLLERCAFRACPLPSCQR
jgi:hypothetical protein